MLGGWLIAIVAQVAVVLGACGGSDSATAHRTTFESEFARFCRDNPGACVGDDVRRCGEPPPVATSTLPAGAQIVSVAGGRVWRRVRIGSRGHRGHRSLPGTRMRATARYR